MKITKASGWMGMASLLVTGVLTGCGLGTTETNAVHTYSQAGVMSGAIHGGQNPVKYATVNLYSAGTTGYGSAGTLLATYTTGADGVFNFVKSPTNGTSSGSTGNTWACPATSDDPQLYLMSTGGNPQLSGGNDTDRNPAITLVAALGPCSGVTNSTFVIVDELSTAAAAYALSAYITPGTTAGSSTIGTNGANVSTSTPQGAVGLNNAVLGIPNLKAVTTTYAGATGTGSTVANVTVTATPEAGKMNQIADILAACVNSVYTSSNTTPSALCTQLFNAATPKTGTTAPADIFQAAYNMATNPTDAGTFTSCGGSNTTNIQCLAALAQGTGAPFQTASATVPTDWTVGVTYSTNFNPASSFTLGQPGTCSNSPVVGVGFFNGPARAAVDASGNIWVINGQISRAALVELSPYGQPLQCLVPLQASTTAQSYGQDITIDPSGNVWGVYSHGTTANQIVEIPSGSTTIGYYTPAVQAYSIVSDPDGNIFYTQQANGASLFELENPVGGGLALSTTLSTTNTLSSTPATITALTSYTSSASTSSYPMVNMAAPSTGAVFGDTTGTTALLGAFPLSASITAYSVSGGVATFTAANTFTAGQIVTISGLSTTNGVQFNGRFAVASATTSSFTVSTAAANIASTTDAGAARVTGAGAYTALNTSLYSTSYGLGLGASNFLYTGTACCGSTGGRSIATRVATSATGYVSGSSGSNSTSQNLGGLTGTRSVAVDGAGNVWMGQLWGATSNSSNAPVFGLVELTASTSGVPAFAAVSPTGGESCATITNGACTGAGGFEKPDFQAGADVKIDPSGNVWYLNEGTAASGTLTVNGVTITEVVGAAAPVVTPLSLAAKNGKLGAKP